MINRKALETFTTDELREYIGWLRKCSRTDSIRYDNIKGDELDALRLKYNCCVIDNTLKINKTFLCKKNRFINKYCYCCE